MEYELYPDGASYMRAHVVVTSYEAPVDDHSKSFFHKVKWAGLIVDEGQRLKNDRNLLYGALSALNVPFRVLLTGLSCNLFHTLLLIALQVLRFRITSESFSTFCNSWTPH
jgi:hypothetical protein